MFYIVVNQYKTSYHYSLTNFSLKISFFGIFGSIFAVWSKYKADFAKSLQIAGHKKSRLAAAYQEQE